MLISKAQQWQQALALSNNVYRQLAWVNYKNSLKFDFLDDLSRRKSVAVSESRNPTEKV